MTTARRVQLYREVHGAATARSPLLLIPGGGSTIGTNFGALLPLLTPTRQVIAVEVQGHGHTPVAMDRPFTFENSADDVAATLRELGAPPVDVLGFSNGGNVAMRLAMRHPGLVRRQIVASAFYRREGMVDGFWDGFPDATTESMPRSYRDADRAINPDPAHLRQVFELDTGLMSRFVDWGDDELVAMTTPTLVVGGDRDVPKASHTAAMAELIPDARLLILPSGHGDYLGELAASGGDLRLLHATLPLLLGFLDETG